MRGLVDTTLREGGQTIGVSFSLVQKKAIVKALVETGIEEIELGIVSRFDQELFLLMEYSQKLQEKTRFSVWSLCRHDDIEYAASLRPDILSLSIPVSDLHIYRKLAKSREWVISTLRCAVAYANSLGLTHISLGLEDATRADPNFLEEVIAVSEQIGVCRVRLADTVGIASPEDIRHLVAMVTRKHSVEVGIHTHNDFGMATANCITALDAGAHWADVTVLGLGERTGNARLEEVAGYLALKKDRSYKTKILSGLCTLVSQGANQEISPRHPIVGRDIFSCETGLHLQGLEEDPKTYEPYNPSKVGAKRKLIYGAKIGRNNLRKRLASLRHNFREECMDSIVSAIRKKALEVGHPLKDSEIITLGSEI